MNFEANDFPLYNLLTILGEERVQEVVAERQLQPLTLAGLSADAAKAKGGDIESTYVFTAQIFDIAFADYIERSMPELTKETQEKTLQKCVSAFGALANKGHAMSSYMVGHCKLYGIGCTYDPQKAVEMFEVAEKQGVADKMGASSWAEYKAYSLKIANFKSPSDSGAESPKL